MKTMIALASALLLAAPLAAETLVDNVNGYTVGADGKVKRFTGILIGNDGRVKEVLTQPLKRKQRPDYRVDGKGRVMLPGLIDAHGHVMGLGISALQIDLSDTSSLQEAQAKIAAFAKANPSPRWIVGRGWNQEKWGLGRFPTAADLDAAVKDRPVWLERVDGHAGWANSQAMKEAGVTAASQSPAGGRVEMTGGKPAGVFVDAAMELVAKSVPPPVPLVRDQALAKAQDILLSNGITATADMGTSIADWATMRRYGDSGLLKVRIMAYAGGLDALLATAGTQPTPWLYNGKLKMGGVKLYGDGALGSRGAWLKQPYADAPGEKGLAFNSDTALRNLMSRAAMDKFQIAVHAIGDAANDQALGAIEELALTYKDDRRWRIEHAQIVDPADLKRFANYGIIASMQPVHEASDWRMAQARLGPDRLSGAYAWRSILDNKGRLAFGSDYPVESPNPFHGLSVAISRQDASGQPAGGWMPQQNLILAEGLAAFTQGAAYAGFAEKDLGGLEKGRYADFIFVDRDIFAVTPREVREAKVLETWVGGQKVWQKK